MKTIGQTPMRPVERRKPLAVRNGACEGPQALRASLEGIPAGCKLLRPHNPVKAGVNLPAGRGDLQEALGVLCGRLEREVLLGTW